MKFSDAIHLGWDESWFKVIMDLILLLTPALTWKEDPLIVVSLQISDVYVPWEEKN